MNEITQRLDNIEAILKELKQGIDVPLTAKEAAKYLGVSLSYLYKLTSTNKIPHYKGNGGKMVYFEKVELNNWMLAHRIKTHEELEAQAIDFVNKRVDPK